MAGDIIGTKHPLTQLAQAITAMTALRMLGVRLTELSIAATS
ncbi:MAG: hypothetical protein ACYDEV_00960 [Acidiferrobacter sp.]